MRIPVGYSSGEFKRMILLGFLLLLENAIALPGDRNGSQRRYLTKDNHQNDNPTNPEKFRSNYEAYEDKQADEKDTDSKYDFYTPYEDPSDDKDSFSIGFRKPKLISENIQSYLRKKYLDKSWLKPSQEDKEWLKTDAHDEEEDKEKPIYGYQPDTDDIPKKSKSISSLYDGNDRNKAKSLKDRFRKWGSGEERYLVKENSEPIKYRNEKKKTIHEKQVDYEEKTVHPNAAGNSDSGANYNTQNPPKYTNYATDVEKWHGPPNKYEGGRYGSPFHDEANKEVSSNHGDLNKQVVLHHEEYYSKPELLKELQQGPVKQGWAVEAKSNSNYPDPDSRSPGGKDFKKPFVPKRYSHLNSELNHGGHTYGWTYGPDLHAMYEKDLEKKDHFLKEHERKLTDLQKKHMESYKKFMQPFEDGVKGHIMPEAEGNLKYSVENEKGSSDKFPNSYHAPPPKNPQNFTWENVKENFKY